MRLQKMLSGAFFVAFFLLLSQGIRWVLQQEGERFICNYVGAFGLQLPLSILLSVTIGVLLLFGVQWWREERPTLVFSWAALFAGGVSNLWERVFYGCVTDYIVLPYLPTFNLADLLLTTGVVGVVWMSYARKQQEGS